MATKRYPVVKRVNLAGFSEEWDETCYAMIAPATYEDRKALINSGIKDSDTEALLEWQLKVVTEHFISGKIKVFDGEAFSPVDMTVEDAVASIDLADYLYSEIMGLGLDPKDIRAVAQRATLQSIDPKPTETSSSTNKQRT